MSRSGYSEDYDNDWTQICYRGAVASAFRGARGQKFLREMRDALEAMPEKRLVAEHLVTPNGDVCALGCVGFAKGVDVMEIDPEDSETVAGKMGIATAMAREIAYENDGEFRYWDNETPETRWARMRNWVESRIT